MVVQCISFGSLSWLRPGNVASDPLRFSEHAAAFNTSGFAQTSKERRFWHTPGVIRMNIGQHHGRVFEPGKYESAGIEKRGEWNRVLLGRRVRGSSQSANRILLCLRSGTDGRIDFSSEWHSGAIQIVAGSALRDEQETMILAVPQAEIRTEKGWWEVTWTGLLSK